MARRFVKPEGHRIDADDERGVLANRVLDAGQAGVEQAERVGLLDVHGACSGGLGHGSRIQRAVLEVAKLA